MTSKDITKEAWQALRASPLRSLLTMLGIVIGIAAIIILLTLGRGAERVITEELESFGSDLVFVLAGGEGTNIASSASLRILTNDDIEAMKKPGALPSAESVAALTRVARSQVQGIDREISVSAWGVDREYFELQNIELEEGRYWTEDEQRARKKVAVLGGTVDEDLFGEVRGPLVGERIKLGNDTYRIIGVIKEQEGLLSSFGNENNEYVSVPLEVAQQSLVGTPDYVWGVTIKSRGPEFTESLEEEVTALLRDRHRLRGKDKNDFTFLSQDQFLDIFATVSSIFTLFLAAIGGISLLVGGIGIMNIMLVTVTERFREIGIRKALGARQRDILGQFLAEALLITTAGGIVGVAMGLGVAYLVASLASISFAPSLFVVLYAVIGSSIFGLLFGLWPATKAAKLDPIKAIRH